MVAETRLRVEEAGSKGGAQANGDSCTVLAVTVEQVNTVLVRFGLCDHVIGACADSPWLESTISVFGIDAAPVSLELL
jgi:hypothetical protein